MSYETTNCQDPDCGALVYVTDVPSKNSGYCWRCEVKRLRAALQRIAAANTNTDPSVYARRVLAGKENRS